MQRKKFVNALIITALSLTACTDGQTTDIQTQPREADDLLKPENIMYPEFKKALADNGLIFKDCKYLGEFTEADFDDFIAYCNSGDSYGVTDLVMRKSSFSFNIRKQRDITKVGMSEEEWREYADDLLISILTEFPDDPPTMKVELFWNYKGVDFSTICVVRKEDGRARIVWDNITSRIIIPGPTIYRDSWEDAKRLLDSLRKTRSDDPPFHAFRGFNKPFYNDFRALAAEVGYDMMVFGDYGRNGEPAITGEISYGFREIHKLDWHADSQARCADLNEGMVWWDFAWGASDNSYVNITYRGPRNGYEVTGALPGMWDADHIILTASNLMPTYPDM